MAFLKTSDSIMIRATLTEKGKKLLARGKFKVAKFTLGDDEIDYELYRATGGSNYFPAVLMASSLEANKDINKNIQFGLNSYDSGVLYLSEEQLEDIDRATPHAYVDYLPVLKTNDKISYSPTLRNDKYYVSINDETTKIINDGVPNFKFLQTNDLDIRKLVVETGILNSTYTESSSTEEDGLTPTIENRENLIVKKFLLDRDFFLYADNRFVSTIVGINESSRFENFSSGEKIINFNTATDSVAISLESEFEYFATYIIRGIPNLLFDYEEFTDSEKSIFYSAIGGARGSVVALNVKVDNELKTNSTGPRDSRFTQFGTLESNVFSELPTTKFDYIDTTIYIIGATSNARLQIPLRIIRYAGT
jgi:hypothetical protein